MNAPETHRPQHVNVKPYLFVFGALLCLTILTVLVSYWHLPIHLAIFVALAIATLKASLVATFFMHLNHERAVVYGLLGLTAFFVGLLYILPITDSHMVSGRSVHTPVIVAEDVSATNAEAAP